MIINAQQARSIYQSATGVQRLKYQVIHARMCLREDKDEARRAAEATLQALEASGELLAPVLQELAHAQMLFVLTNCALSDGHPDRAAALQREALAITLRSPDKVLAVDTLLKAAVNFDMAENYPRMLDILSHALQIFECPDIFDLPSLYFDGVSNQLASGREETLLLLRVRLEYNSARAQFKCGHCDQAVSHVFRAIADCDKMSAPIVHAYRAALYMLLAEVYLDLGCSVKARDAVEKFEASARKSADPVLLAKIEFFWALIYADRCDFTRVIDICRTALASNCSGLPLMRCRYNELLSRAYRATAQARKALTVCQEALQDKELAHGRFSRCLLLAESIRNLEHCQQTSKARRQALELLESARALKFNKGCIEAHAALSRLYASGGKATRALQHAQEAQSIAGRQYSAAVYIRVAEAECRYKLLHSHEEARLQLLRNERLEQELRTRDLEIERLNNQLTAKTSVIESARRRACSSRRNGAAADDWRELIVDLDQDRDDKDAWRVFADRFFARNPDFNEKLKELGGIFSAAELKICALCAARMSIKDSAALLLVSESAVLKMRWRIRKKLQLRRSQNLAGFLAAI